MQILFEHKPHSRVRFGSNPLEMYKVEFRMGIQMQKYTVSIKREYTETHKINLEIFIALINQYFDLDELDSIIFELELDTDNIYGKTKLSKVREFIKNCANQGFLDKLWERCQKERPHVNWFSALQNFNKESQKNRLHSITFWRLLLAAFTVLGLGIAIGLVLTSRTTITNNNNPYAGSVFVADFDPVGKSYSFEECATTEEEEMLSSLRVVIGDQKVLTCSTSHVFSGVYSLAVPISIQERSDITSRIGVTQIWLQTDNLFNKLLVLRIFVPQEAPPTSAAQLFILDRNSTPHFGPITFLRPGTWNTLIWATANDYEGLDNPQLMGIEFKIEGTNLSDNEKQFQGTFYLDDIQVYSLVSP